MWKFWLLSTRIWYCQSEKFAIHLPHLIIIICQNEVVVVSICFHLMINDYEHLIISSLVIRILLVKYLVSVFWTFANILNWIVCIFITELQRFFLYSASFCQVYKLLRFYPSLWFAYSVLNGVFWRTNALILIKSNLPASFPLCRLKNIFLTQSCKDIL